MTPEHAADIPGNVFPGRVRVGLDRLVLPSRNSLQLPASITFSRWQHIGEQILTAVDTSAWWLADWLVYGQDNYKDRYEEAIRTTSLRYQTLRNYAWVARRFPLSRRRDKLSFGHHAELTALPEPEQDYWFRRAEQFNWSRNEMRRAVRASLREREDGAGAKSIEAQTTEPANGKNNRERRAREDGGSGTVLTLNLSGEQFAWCEMAASQQNSQIEEWAVRTLVQQASCHSD